MRKILYASLTVWLVLMLATQSWAASSATMTIDTSVDGIRIVTIGWTAHTDGTFTSVSTDSYTHQGRTITQWIKGYYLYLAETDPGGTQPTDNYDITLSDANAVDLFGGLLANRDEATTELVNVGNATHGFPVVRGPLTLAISGNSVNTANGTIILVFVK
ncbi:MAG: hypothetical protein ABFE01_22515 [Phycisphaerales bacterium]